MYGHDLRAKDWHDIQRPDLAELMRVAKTTIVEGVSLMNAVLWNAFENVREEVRQEKDQEKRELFANLLALDVKPETLAKAAGLSEEELLKQVNSSAS